MDILAIVACFLQIPIRPMPLEALREHSGAIVEQDMPTLEAVEAELDLQRQYAVLERLLPEDTDTPWGRRREIARLALEKCITQQHELAGMFGVTEPTITKDVVKLKRLIEHLETIYLETRASLPGKQQQEVLRRAVMLGMSPEEIAMCLHLEEAVVQEHLQEVQQAFLRRIRRLRI